MSSYSCAQRVRVIGLLNNKLFITPQLAAAPLKGKAMVQCNDLVFNVCCQIKWATQLGADSATDHVIGC